MSVDAAATPGRVLGGVRGTHLIGGRPDAGDGARELVHRDPAHPDVCVGVVPVATGEVVDSAVRAAAGAAAAWAARTPVDRGRTVERLAGLVERDAVRLATLVSREHGKPARDARDEVARTVDVLRFAAGEGRRLGGQTLPADVPGTACLTMRVPIGVVALVTPWNFPLAIPAWKLGWALTAGCPAVVKPSPLAPFSAQALVELAHEAGVPPDAVGLVHGDGETGSALVRHPLVAGVSFTGSVATGRRIARDAVDGLTRLQLEMGGKNALVVEPDADLGRAAAAVVSGAFGQAGQRCSATSRLLVHEDVADRLVELVRDRAAALRSGPAEDDTADLGPLIDEVSLERCVAAVAQAVRDGGRVVLGGARVPGLEGWFMQPTVVVDLPPGAALATTEVFGPVLVVNRYRSFDEALALLDGVEYGMSAALFTFDVRKVARFVASARAGMLHVNRPGTGAFPHMPHVGTKASQHGAAECSPEAMDFYTEIRTVTLDLS